MMTAGFRGKNPVKDWSQLSIKRVAKDVSALTNVSTMTVKHDLKAGLMLFMQMESAQLT